MPTFTWSLPFLEPESGRTSGREYALIILNQPFTFALLRQLWHAAAWRCCADGGANRLLDTVAGYKARDNTEATDLRNA